MIDLLRSEIEKENRVYEGLEKLATLMEQGSLASAEGVREQVIDILLNAQSNLLPPSWRAIIQEIGGASLVGLGLASRLQALLEDYRLSPKEAASVVRAIHGEILNFNGFINNHGNSARGLGIKPYTLAPGTCEIGVLYPEVGVIHDLESLVNESEQLDTALRAFMEVGGATGSPNIKQLSSSEPSMFFEVVASVGAAVATAISKVLGIIKSKLEIDKLRLEIEQKKIDPESAKRLKSRVQSVENEGLDEATETVLEFYMGSDEGRRNELRISTKNALRFMLVQTQRGVVFEVTASSRTSEGLTTEEAAKIQGPPSIEARQLKVSKELGGSMKELAAKREQLLLPYMSEAEEKLTSHPTGRKSRKRGSAD